ncbi:MAG: hypothetical protein KatS3mg002_0139 [Candidatus Woesearchaeota archaeon]|nr:MAG: hypothetical protein KatS3mg002_0139 [Candidatus Woesearchaeota archaeon]
MEVVNLKFNISLFFLSLFLLVFFLVGFVSAANWYVDRDAPVGGNGQSWGTAWNNFSVINWSRVQPGDTIYISGGVTEKVYNEGMTIGKSGTVNNPIIITRGKDPGHNGRVILRSPVQSSGFGVYIYEKSNIIIEDLDLELWATSVYIKSRTSPPFDNNPNAVKNIVIRNNRAILAGNFVETNNFHSPTNEEYIERIKNIWVINNSWITVNWSSVQTDFFSFGQTKNVFVIGNRGVNYNNNPDTHDDFCQGGDGTNIYFINNFFRHDNSVTKMGNANGLSGISNYGGDGFFINNILVEPPTSIGYPIMLFYRPIERPDLYYRNWVKVKILGNTLVAAHVSGIRYGYDPYGEIKNNIFLFFE